MAEPVTTARLALEPLRPEHADEMVAVLADPRLYVVVGGGPPLADQLRERYARQAVGHSPDGQQGWLNWVLRDRASGRPLGFVQATVTDDQGVRTAELAWVVGGEHQGQGFASEAAGAVAGWLRSHGVGRLVAHVHADNVASGTVARRAGLAATDVVVEGETRWATP